MTSVLLGLWTTRQPYPLSLLLSSFPFLRFAILLPCWDWHLWGFAVAMRVWAVIRGWVMRMGSGWFGNDCIQWHRASFCLHDCRRIVPGSPERPCAMECAGTDCDVLGQEPRHRTHIWASVGLRALWPAVMQFQSICKSRGFSLFIFPSMEWNWLYF